MSSSLLLMRFSLSLVLLAPALFSAASVSNASIRLPEIENLQKDEKPHLFAQSEVIARDDRADDPKVWKKRGRSQFREGRYQDALFSFNQAILVKEDDPEAWNLKGETLRKLKRNEEALDVFEKALEIRPLLTRAMHNKGAVLLDLGRLKKALAVYEVLIRRNASDAMAWKEKAEVLSQLNRDFEALDAVSQALDIRPGFEDAALLKERLEAKIQRQRFHL